MVDFSYSEEQQLLKDSVERFAREQMTIGRRRELVASDDGFSRDNWAKFAELGWLAAPFSEASGGLGGGPLEVMVLMEAFGRGLALEPFLATVLLAGGLLEKGGNADQKAALLPGVVAGETMLAFAYAEPRSRFALNDVATRAARDGAGYRLTGHKAVVFHGASADTLVVSARTSGEARDADGITLFLVDPAADGVTLRGYGTVDGLRAADIRLDDVAVGEDAVVGAVGAALPLIEEVVDRATVALCAEALGLMDVLYETTLEYSKTRQQFGRPIGKFQVVQHRLVDMFVACQQARSMVLMATLKLDTPERRRAVSAAKVHIGRAGRLIGQEAVQLHGGMGMTEELIVGHYFKRLTMIDTCFGNVDHHLARFAA